MTTFFTADHHFDHKNIIEYCDRPFSSVEEMNQVMIDRWNEVVEPSDVVYHLGDFLFARTRDLRNRAREIFAQLNGEIVLFRGNHDKRLGKVFAPFRSASGHQVELHKHSGTVWLNVGGWQTAFVVSHEPPFFTNSTAYYLHGHCHHNRVKVRERQLDVGVDGYDFYPITVQQVVKEILKTQIA